MQEILGDREANAVRIHNLKTGQVETLQTDGVFIYIQGGDVSFGGNTYFDLTRSGNLSDYAGNQWAGMLLYMDINNTGTVYISGGTDAYFKGTILAQGPANPVDKTKCKIVGDSEGFSLDSQVICYSIELTGSSNIDITYNAEDNFVLPPTLELVD